MKACMDLVPAIEMSDDEKRKFLLSFADERRKRTIAKFEDIFAIELERSEPDLLKLV